MLFHFSAADNKTFPLDDLLALLSLLPLLSLLSLLVALPGLISSRLVVSARRRGWF